MKKASRDLPSIDEFRSQPSDTLAIPLDERDNLIISMRRIDGVSKVVSLYGDSVWWLTGGPVSTSKAIYKIDFSAVPSTLRDATRSMIYRYLRRGVRNARHPQATTISAVFGYISYFLNFVGSLGISKLSDITPMTCSAYVHFARTKICSLGGKNRTIDPSNRTLASSTLYKRLTAVEKVFELSQYTHDAMRQPPWIDSSADMLAGGGKNFNSTTPLIPDDVFSKVFQRAFEIVQSGKSLLDLRDGLEAFDLRTELSPNYVTCLKTNFLQEAQIPGYREFKKQLRQIRTACYIVAASLSGCRFHELAEAKTGCCYSTDVDGERFWWLRTKSSKTYEGTTEWMVPEVVAQAISLLERWSKPYQDQLGREVQHYKELNPTDIRRAEAMDHINSIFVGLDMQKGNIVRTVTVSSMNEDLKEFAKSCGLKWPLATHQFRRKFANYVARSQFGDLRYLREHFKHWSLDMTLRYALNESQEMALYLEIQDELDDIKYATVSSWLDERQPLAGGYGQRLVDWRARGEAIPIFKSRTAMIRSIADSTPIRSNGHAWCTAGDNLCIGNDLERTKCGDGCENAVIGSSHQDLYQGLYDQLCELLELDEIGPGGRARVSRDLNRCIKVLKSLGHDVGETNHGPA